MFCAFSLPNVLFATAACNFSGSELQKVLPDPHFFNMFTSECAFRHSGVQFFNIWTSKSAPGPSVFLTFSLPNVPFATAYNFSTSELQKVLPDCQFFNIFTSKCGCRHSGVHFFRHLNFKKCSEHLMFCAFSLQNVLLATAACNFWFLLWAPTSAPAALTGLLLDWPDTRTIEKTRHFATSLTFGADVSPFFWLSRYCIFFLLTWLLYSAFQLSILSEVSI